ncbi:MAG: hypothetical protein HWN65_16850 [Candidatus Helarchaeota archaeon]|nr:hypothetical protein [Candidatus Helarchaeota archaeon]
MNKTIKNAEYGNGKFGRWIIDKFNLPAYDYTCMQTLDPDARTNTSGKDSIDHWHQVGNDRITLTAHNGGYVQFFIADRGMQWLSFHNLRKDCLGGGICFIEENGRVWSDLYNSKLNQNNSSYKRIFGCGYYQKELERKGIKIEHFIYPPFGDDPVVLSEITVTNNSDKSRDLRVYDFWGIKLKSLIGSLLAMFIAPKERTKFGDSKVVSLILRFAKNLILALGLGAEQTRERFSSKFTFMSEFNTENSTLILTPKYKSKIPVKEDEPADRNYYLDPIFLASFDRELPIMQYNQVRIRRKNVNTYVMQKSYQTVSDESPSLMLGHELSLQPRETKRLYFIFGTAKREQIAELVQKYKKLVQSNNKERNFDDWKKNSLQFSLEADPWLAREAVWHSYYLRSASLFDAYYDNHYLPQGNAYTFLHGANGAIRDYVLFLIPMIYLNPQLAREMLEYMFRTMTPEGELPYALVGYGKNLGAIVHETSSDLHLFLLWGLLEYLYATRDFQFLDVVIPFYPLDSQKRSTVLERILISLKFLFQKVGIGGHGLIKVGSGDWSDGISLLVKNRSKFLKKGESTFNSAFALYVFPLLIDLLNEKDPKTARFLKQKYEQIKEACLNTWNGRWFYRGWEGTGDPIGENNLFLEHHPWLLLSGVLSPNQIKILVNNIHGLLDVRSKTGQFILYPPVNVMLNILPRGWDVNGGIWHAMNFLLTWAYSRHDVNKGYQSLLKNSMAMRAEAYPQIWYGIWSGSDSYNADYPGVSNPGQTFIHPATPQTDFPIMNLNLHANFLSSIIKLVGINFTFEGLTIDPKLPYNKFRFRTPVFTLETDENKIKGFYRPSSDSDCLIRVRKPEDWTKNITASVNGRPVREKFEIEDQWLLLKLRIPDAGISFSLEHL